MKALKSIVRTLTDRAARSYVAGPHLSDAIDLAARLARDGMTSTIAYWNDVGEDPADVCAACLAAIDGAADAGIPSYVSIKAPALSMSAALAGALAARCRDRHIGLHFDSLALEHQARTFDLIDELLPTGIAVGCTLPSRFGRSLLDVERVVAGRLRARVVKGQWDDPGQRLEPRASFMALIDRLAGRAAHVAVATHDPVLAEEALALLAARGTPAELELLLGLPTHHAMGVAQRLKLPVRVYIPYGHAWLPYALSAVRRNPRILRWLLEDALRGRPSLARQSP